MPVDLACPSCGRTYPAGADEPWRCVCGSPLEFDASAGLDRPRPAPADVDARRGLWAFEELLSVSPAASLGEGFTPLVDAPEWNAGFKLEYVFPTGSFKDRGATTLLSRAAALDVSRVLEDSSGNAGAAIATYAARAGIDAEIYVPAGAKASKLAMIERTGARAVRVEGSREAVTEACVEAVERGEGWYASHAWNPAFFAGTQTVAFEIAAQRDWEVPDAVVIPLGHGTLFLGAYRGFRTLHEAGWIDSLPRLLGAQASGFAPIADSLHGPTAEENELADGVRIREPVREGEIAEAIEETDGDAIAVPAADTERELDRLHRAGFFVEPTSALAPAALREYRASGVLDADADVVVPLTGSGLKATWS
ncbi:pyridoxal-phosphate dependent enzyme [Halalkalicoccus sp. GCM10025322]|uniref:pyridoxal-phosphate dependent enzyme n=1 Tax=Halalkalicoccus TaxID=332246 RepID=UPI002F9684FB